MEEKVKNKGGRPRKELDKSIFEELCHIQCTRDEICSVLSVEDDTLNSWCKRTYGEGFSACYKKYSEGGKRSLRRMQWALAEKNPAMAIWLGKQYLNQSDKIDNNVSGITVHVNNDVPTRK